MSNPPLLTFENQGRIVLGRVDAASVLDAVNVSQLGAELLAYVGANPGVNLLLDFGNVEYLSSAVLTELLRINKALKETSGDLRLCALTKDVRKVFEITNLDRVFIIYGEADNAVRRFERSLSVADEEDAWSRLTRDSD